jgi:hypothetical protein
MAVEPIRGCGYRKIGGLYLVSGSRGVVCDRLPIPLEVCPTCHHGIKQSRGWTWVDAAELIGGLHPECQDDFPCPLCMTPEDLGRCGLLWIGEKYYPTPRDFDYEAQRLGVSRRISAIPRGFKVGETWILFAHPAAVEKIGTCECGHDWTEHCANGFGPCGKCEKNACQLFRVLMIQGIFKVWRPERIEKIVPESWKVNPEKFDELQDLADKGITPVFVPDDDPDHRGRNGDDEDGEGETARTVPTANRE